MTKRNALLPAVLCALGLAGAPSVHAVDGLSLELGASEDDANLVRLGLQWDWQKRWPVGQRWQIDGYWDASLAYWSSDAPGGRDLWDLGLTPTFRLRPATLAGTRPYVEAGIGQHLLSRSRLDDRHDYGGAFQFGSHIGFGATFGERSRYSLGYRLQHLSNANLHDQNDGINFHELRFGYGF